mgnify:CR=1 FL=1
MIILGIDPGSRICGYGILEISNREIIAAGCDTIRLTGVKEFPQRLKLIFEKIDSIIKKYKPDIFVIESIFYGKNIKSAFKLGHARGVMLLAAAKNNLEIHEYSPREIKKAIVGNGNASKKQVKYMVERVLNINLSSKSQDAADALAAAICEYNKIKFKL